MVLDGDINVKQIKEITRQIAQEQTGQYDLEVNLLPMTIVEYYNSDFFKKNLILTKHGKTSINKTAVTLPFAQGAAYDAKTKCIILFVKDLKKIKRINPDDLLPYFISLTYHELRHPIQSSILLNTTNIDLSSFVYDLETVVHGHNKQDYFTYYDDYFIEIDADLYGINNALAYLERNKMLSEGSEKYLNNRKKMCESRLKRYDFQRIFKQFHEVFLRKPEIVVEDLGWLGETFYNQDKTFKSVTEILQHPIIRYIDNSVLQIIFSSEPFLKNLDFQNLSCENQEFIIESVRNSYYHEQKRRLYIRECLNQGLIDGKKWINLDTTCAHNICHYVNALSNYVQVMSKDDRENLFLEECAQDLEQGWTI